MRRIYGYLLTWTCYGTWLHGDERGSVDDEHNGRDTPKLLPDEGRYVRSLFRMTGVPYLLDDAAREVVETVIRKHCEIRRWHLLAVNARTNHVHVVVNCNELVSPDTATDQFKAWFTRRLRENGHAGVDQEVWTEGGSGRWLTTEQSFLAAVAYVLHGQ